MNLKTTLTILILGATAGSFSQTDDPVPLMATPPTEVAAALNAIPERENPFPNVADGIPYQQHDQNALVPTQEALTASIIDLPGIHIEPT